MRSGYPVVKWYNQWDLSIFDKMYRYKRAEKIINGNIYSLLEKTQTVWYQNRLMVLA